MAENLDDLIEQNLAAYIEANATVLPTDFKVKRELSIARLSLEESLQIHRIAISALKTALSALTSSNSSTVEDISTKITNIITLANHMEERGHRLTQNCKAVAGIAKTGAEIENLLATKLDAVQIYSIIAQLPTLLLTLLNSILLSFFRERNLSIVNGHPLRLEEIVPELANVVSSAFNEQIEQNLSVLTYPCAAASSNAAARGDNATGRGNGVIESQVVAMLNSVPTSRTVVVQPGSELAETIKNI